MQTETQASPKETAQARLKAAEINLAAARERLATFQRTHYAMVAGRATLLTNSMDEQTLADLRGEETRLRRQFEECGQAFQAALKVWAETAS